MHEQKQKQIQGEFQEIKQQVQTFNSANYSPSRQHNQNTSNIRQKLFSQKQKIALLLAFNVKEVYYTPSATKKNTFYHGKILKVGSATFRSNYQCGNIEAVDLVGVNLYKISLGEQTNSSRGNSWFYFTVEGVKGQAQFIIQGFTKKTSLYNEDMKICYRDVKEHNKWRRGCTCISYKCTDQQAETLTYQLRFKYFFKNNQNHSVQFAYAFPYGLTRLQNFINSIFSKVKIQILGKTYDGRDIPMILIGNQNSKEVIIISSRVHPGETCSSFIVQGLVKELLGDSQHSVSLREKYLFKIVPMINIDGVVHGNYRFSAVGVDLNRKWKQPTQLYHPEIFYLKEMIFRENAERKIIMYIDMHGHSRKKNVFFYGCPIMSNNEQSTETKSFPFLMSKIYEAFSFFDCSFNVQKQKQGTARVNIWKQLQINEVFTLEASMCSSSVGKNYTQNDYQKIGRKLCEGICIYFTNIQEIESENMKKQYKLKKDAINQLINDPFLRKIGNQQDQGSQSQPEKGQNTDKFKLQKSKKKKDARVNGYTITSKSKTKDNKQKSQSTIFLEDKELVKEKQTFQFLFQTPKNSKIKQKSTPNTAHSRLGGLFSKNIYYKTAIKSITYDVSCDAQINEKYIQKNKINLLVNWQGAQYRRVRKTAQNIYKKQMQDVEIKGISTKKIEIERNKALIPKLTIKNKLKRTSAQIYSKKAMRMQEMQYVRQELNVVCLGKHIKM